MIIENHIASSQFSRSLLVLTLAIGLSRVRMMKEKAQTLITIEYTRNFFGLVSIKHLNAKNIPISSPSNILLAVILSILNSPDFKRIEL